MAKKKVSNNNLFLILIILIVILTILIFIKPHLIKSNQLSPSPTISEANEFIPAYFEDGTKTRVKVFRSNERFLFGNIESRDGMSGSSKLLKNIDGKWITVGDTTQAYLCTYFTKLGMIQEDMDDLKMIKKNGVCLLVAYPEKESNWDPDPIKFTESP